VGDNSIAIGLNAGQGNSGLFATGTDAIAIGHGATATGTNTTATGAGSSATAENASAFGGAAMASGLQSTAIGTSAHAMGLGSTATGVGAAATGIASTAVGFSATATAFGSVAIGAGSTTGARASTVSVGSPGIERQITNVAAGTAPTDAVNLSQLQGGSSAMNAHINEVGNTAFAGVADAMALSYPVWFSKPGDTSLTGGYGYYRGQNAVGGGIYHLDESGKFTYGVGLAFSPNTGGAGVRAGFSVKLF
jgi:autotransporter adhesin